VLAPACPYLARIAGGVGSRRRRGFTLLELLVCIAIVAVLVSLLLPLMSDARLAGQRAVSLSNLHSNVQYMSAYTLDHKDDFLNPFTMERLRVSHGWDSCCVVFEPVTHPDEGHHPYEYGWDYGQQYSTSGTETFGYHWLAHMFYADIDTQTHLKSNVAPMDRALLGWYRDHAQAAADKGAAWIFPSSYWYSPVFWQDFGRFERTDRSRAWRGNNFLIRRNKTTDVFTPSAKVLLFENKDFTAKDQPMWNTVAAKPQVVCVDGSGKSVSMNTTIHDTAGPNSTSPDMLLAPSGPWFTSAGEGESEMTRFDYGIGFGFDWSQGYGRPAYFWATRMGIRGRDIR
jgi:prepilin-type N-terminal cleavage/methylation domain-containing protein